MKASASGGENPDAVFVEKRVWDIPTRLFHWALVMTVITGLYLGEFREFSTIELHFYAGYATAALLAFRILWGFTGSKPSRIRALFPSPKRFFKYTATLRKRHPSGIAGHNPLGALSVLAMITALLFQVITGLFSEDDGLFSEGPLAGYAGGSTVLTMTSLHHTGSRVIMALIGIHILAILFYLLWKRENLIKPMLTGIKLIRRNTD